MAQVFDVRQLFNFDVLKVVLYLYVSQCESFFIRNHLKCIKIIFKIVAISIGDS